MVHCVQNGRVMTKEEFERWLKTVDANNDGQISRKELQDALRALGVPLTLLRSWFALVKADINRNHVIDGQKEVKKLIDHAKKHWGIIVTN